MSLLGNFFNSFDMWFLEKDLNVMKVNYLPRLYHCKYIVGQ